MYVELVLYTFFSFFLQINQIYYFDSLANKWNCWNFLLNNYLDLIHLTFFIVNWPNFSVIFIWKMIILQFFVHYCVYGIIKRPFLLFFFFFWMMAVCICGWNGVEMKLSIYSSTIFLLGALYRWEIIIYFVIFCGNLYTTCIMIFRISIRISQFRRLDQRI